jgi:cell wall-associated NlpC family hydrolase
MNSVNKISVILALGLALVIGSVSTAEAGTPIRTKALKSALTQKGAKYIGGREGGYSKGYDCSGLTYWAFKEHGKKIPRVAHDQFRKSKKISFKNRKPGDLVFIHYGSGSQKGYVYHVGILSKIVKGKAWIINANAGKYRGRKVVEAPLHEYAKGTPYSSYGRY